MPTGMQRRSRRRMTAQRGGKREDAWYEQVAGDSALTLRARGQHPPAAFAAAGGHERVIEPVGAQLIGKHVSPTAYG
jgi:hypothetical protein